MSDLKDSDFEKLRVDGKDFVDKIKDFKRDDSNSDHIDPTPQKSIQTDKD